MLRHGLEVWTQQIARALNGLLIGRIHALCHRLHVGFAGLDGALRHILALLQPADALESLAPWQPWYFDWQSSCLVPSSAYWSDSCSSFAEHLLHHRHLLIRLAFCSVISTVFVGQSFGIKPFHQGLLVGICLLLHLHLFGIGLSFASASLRPLKASKAAAPCSDHIQRLVPKHLVCTCLRHTGAWPDRLA